MLSSCENRAELVADFVSGCGQNFEGIEESELLLVCHSLWQSPSLTKWESMDIKKIRHGVDGYVHTLEWSYLCKIG